jgi:hypothetical protein
MILLYILTFQLLNLFLIKPFNNYEYHEEIIQYP